MVSRRLNLIPLDGSKAIKFVIYTGSNTVEGEGITGSSLEGKEEERK